jgi:p-hydroxybenzoate 3-monooxygenase
LEQGTADLLCASGIGERLLREGLIHHGVELRFEGRGHRIDMHQLTGRSITVYGQNELMKDLADARVSASGRTEYEAEDVGIRDFDTDAPVIRYRKGGEPYEIACEFIAGCDGFHGICRPSIPPGALRVFEKIYPFGWLGILAEAEPASHELIYASHERRFALLSMRSRSITRLYLQCAVEENLAEWPDGRIWEELETRFATRENFRPNSGPNHANIVVIH